ncbi:hypothetical protein CRG98_020960, partial [Punica granatum]
MAQYVTRHVRVSAVILSMLAAVALAATPPGIAKNPSNARCKDGRYKECMNLEHVCPKFCPDSCSVNCVSCKPVCGNWTAPPVDSSPPPPVTTTPPSPPLPVVVTPSPPPPESESPRTPTPTTPASSPQPPSPSSPSPSTPDSSPPPSNPPPSPTTPTPRTPSSEAAGQQRVRCRNRYYPQCYGQQLTCPSACPTGCMVDCASCKAVCQCDYPGAVCQDPRFIGGDGITFYFHGKKDHDFCLMSDPDLHINAHFIGRRNKYMKRDFSWVQSVGILFGKHRLFVGAQKTATWDDSIDHL